ncbi:hypothetical protein [Polynucleobacter campilacus]|uniref:Polysaccharide chain length determinant N-terminal domain-containing protein n=1 Tax=Polynucleobacter campilacus TaxID=1743163 RepID=A0A254PVW4_9BURK|nr:hypothetical protein [Polynucleobacter campilacus]OWS70685.1 hypothetical protein CBI31_00060 [Polynucleobacter campilacus]
MSYPIDNDLTQREAEISLLDIVNFVQESWKKLAIAAIVGAVLGLSGWFFLGSYQAEYVLLNNNNNNNNNNSYALDLVSWKAIQKSLPNLAAQIEDEGKAPEGQGSLYKALENEQWWQKNVIPSYALSKADTKDLAAISKDLDLASTTILSLTIKADGSSKEKSIENVRAAAKFLRTGSAYLQLRNILNGYETETISTVADLQKRITTTEIEMGYQVQRAKALEDLHKRFPGGNNVSNQVVDPKDSGAKYLPLATQIIAVNNDINLSKEALQRYKDRLAQITQLKIFLDEAMPLTEKTFDGIVLGDELLAVETKMRAKMPKDDIKQQEVLDQLRTQLLSVKSRFTKSLDANTAPTSSKKGMIKTTAGGLAGAFFLMLLVLLGQRVWEGIKDTQKGSNVRL